MSHQYLSRNDALRTWLYKSVPITVIFVLLVRVYMLTVIPRAQWFPKDEFHENKTWVKAVQERAQGLPVVFIGSYQKASKYWFYSQRPSLSMNDIDYRRNNYNFWPLEDSLIGKKVMVVGVYDSVTQIDPIKELGNKASHIFNPYFSFSKVNIRYKGKPEMINKQFTVQGVIETPPGYLPIFQQAPFDTVSIQLAFENENEKILSFPTGLTVRQIKQACQPFRIQVPVSLPRGKYTFRFAISTCIPKSRSMNSTGTKIIHE